MILVLDITDNGLLEQIAEALLEGRVVALHAPDARYGLRHDARRDRPQETDEPDE